MKKQIIGICALCLTLAIGMIILSCGAGPQNSSVVSNENENSNKEVKIASSKNPCDETNIGLKVGKLKAAVETKIGNDDEDDDGNANDPTYHLKYQYNRSFFIDFEMGTGDDAGYAVATVTGAIQGKKKYKKLVDFIEDFVDKDCKIKVVFKAKVQPQPSPGLASNPPAGFEWCESPMMACPGGYCSENCSRKSSNSSSNSANSNSNSANANANKPRDP